MLFIVICVHWKWKRKIVAFNLIVFYCLKTVYIRFFKYFSLYCLFLCRIWLLFKIFYLKRFILFVDKMKCSLLHSNIWLSRKIYWCIMSRGFTGTGIVFAGGQEMNIFSTVFRDFWKNMLGTWYFQH